MPILLLLVLLAFSQARAAECLTIGVASGGLSSAAIGRIAETLFARAGSCAVIVNLPQSRLNRIETDDSLDGEALRVGSYVEQRPQLMLVPTPIESYSGNLYWPNGREEPRGPNATIGILSGQIWPKQAALARQSEIKEVGSYEEMFELTRAGRIQGFMMAAEAFHHFRAQNEELTRFQMLTVTEVPLYLVVNRRHKALVPRLDREVAALLANGYIEQQLNQSSQ